MSIETVGTTLRTRREKKRQTLAEVSRVTRIPVGTLESIEADHFDVAQACGERALLPAVRAADDDKIVITSGFSCREMIEQNGLRPPLHVAEVIRMALERSKRG